MNFNERMTLDMALQILNGLKAATPDVPVPPDSDCWKVLEQLRGQLEMLEAEITQLKKLEAENEAENKELRTKLGRARRFFNDIEWLNLTRNERVARIIESHEERE